MWCESCRQDVPGVPSRGGKPSCPRCRQALKAANTQSFEPDKIADTGVDLNTSPAISSPPPIGLDDWDFDLKLNALKQLQAKSTSVTPATPTSTLRWDAAHPMAGAEHADSESTGVSHKPVLEASTSERSSWIVWSAILIGLIAFTCGGVLLAWGMITHRDDLWTMGLPIAISGQVALLLGLVMQLERVFQNHRQATRKLKEVDQKIAEIRHAQNMLRVNHSSAGQAFYAHLAEGANPQLLLSDLKGQLDLLAVKLSERRG